MHSSRMCTIRFSGHLSYMYILLPCMSTSMHYPCNTCPPHHACPLATHLLCHACSLCHAHPLHWAWPPFTTYAPFDTHAPCNVHPFCPTLPCRPATTHTHLCHACLPFTKHTRPFAMHPPGQKS